MNCKHSIDEMQALALEKNGQCLSVKFKSIKSPLKWRCSEGHIWETKPVIIMNGSWCPQCARKNRFGYGIEDIEVIAARYGGKCLSVNYDGLNGKLEFQCADGHRWHARPENLLRRGSWCPKCSKSKHFTEEKIRNFVEQMTGLQFPSDSSVLNGLELDLYNETNKLAIEYNGIQHYRFVKAWHRTYDRFESMQRRDARKVKLCYELGIALYVITHEQSTSDELIIDVLAEILSSANIPFAKEIDRNRFYKSLSSLLEIKRIVRQRGGFCLTNEYHGSSTKLKFVCRRGHEFWQEPRHVKSGHWCPQCGNLTISDKNRKLGLKDANDVAASRGGRCLSDEYKSSNHNMLWQCKNGHQWLANLSRIKAGHWCRECAKENASRRRRHPIEELNKMASSMGGRCLAVDYKNNRTPVEWECQEGHRWFARAGNIRSGTWCPVCASKQKSIRMLARNLKNSH